MEILELTEFTWPMSAKEVSAQDKGTLQRVLKEQGGDPKQWSYYTIVDPILVEPVDALYPGAQYKIKFTPPNNVSFRWPRFSPPRLAHEDDVVKNALKIARIPEELYEYYFISDEPDEVMLHYRGDGFVYPGKSYYLRVI